MLEKDVRLVSGSKFQVGAPHLKFGTWNLKLF